ncbi:MAG: hypothetical protein IJX55_07715 [Clostridia bacterium]|nr:hypothetical protein [Clostridia bacterium]
MKNTEFLNLMGDIDIELIEKAEHPKRKRYAGKIWVSAIAACLAVAVAFGAVLGGTPVGISEKDGYAIVRAVYGEDVDEAPFYDYYYDGIDEFYKNMLVEMFEKNGGENAVYSPASLYMSLAMLAEMTDGESRAQILALLGADDIKETRAIAQRIWNACYRAENENKMLIANSVWLNERFDEYLKPQTLGTVAEYHYTSSFSGNFEDEAYTEAIKSWINEQTENLLEDSVGNLDFDPETVFSLISTVYFKDIWENKFSEGETKPMTFYTSANEAVKCDYLCQEAIYLIYEGENFTAILKEFESGGDMLFVLPERGHTPEELLHDEEFLEFFVYPYEKNFASENIAVRIPKFDISSEKDMVETMRNLGVTHIFNADASNFTPLAKDLDIFLNRFDHSVRVSIDENGCVGAGYTAIDGVCGVDPRLMKFDRPFLFSVFTEEGTPLFAGLINNPAKN